MSSGEAGSRKLVKESGNMGRWVFNMIINIHKYSSIFINFHQYGQVSSTCSWWSSFSVVHSKTEPLSLFNIIITFDKHRHRYIWFKTQISKLSLSGTKGRMATTTTTTITLTIWTRRTTTTWSNNNNARRGRTVAMVLWSSVFPEAYQVDIIHPYYHYPY